MTELEFFDANCRLGTPMNGDMVYAADIAALLAEMDRVGVARALVSDVNAGHAGPVFSNPTLAAKLKDDASGRLCGVWHILPECCHELPEGDAFFAAMRESRIRAVKIMPAVHRWPVRRAAIGRQFDALAERRVPVILHIGEVGGWDKVYDIVERFPNNIYILSHTELWGCDRHLRPLLESCPGVHMETCEYWVADGLADLVAAYGAERFLFGSGYPLWNHGQQMLAIRHADISDDAKQLIAAGNLERLLNGVQL